MLRVPYKCFEDKVAAAALGKLTGLALKKPVKNSSEHNLVKRV